MPGTDSSRYSQPSQPARSIPRDAREEVETVKTDRFINIGGADEQVKGTARLLELKFSGTNTAIKWHVDPKTREQLREFRALLLAGEQLLIEHPSAEGGDTSFFLYKRAETPPGFTEYLKGPAGTAGPVKRFIDDGQRGQHEIEALRRKWLLRDVMWFDVESIDGSFMVRASGGQMARIVMILGQEGDDWLLWAELRSGNGSHSLWVGRKIDIDTEVETLNF